MNTIGHLFRLTTFGESHGSAVGGVVDGCPAGLRIDMELVDAELSRRRGDGARETTHRWEPDRVEWLSGLMDGVTLGTPIAFIVRNSDKRSEDYDLLFDCYRPGHADYTYEARYGMRDPRGGGRASARETVARVVAGAIAKQLLAMKGVSVSASAIIPPHDEDDGETYGGVVACRIDGLPAGIGPPFFAKLNDCLAAAVMSIPSAIGFEMGDGFATASMTGRQYADAWSRDTFPKRPCITNHCGGIQGGISNGMPVSFRVAFHPVTTQPAGMDCIDAQGGCRCVAPGGRHDRCQVPRAAVIVEAMTALTLVDAMMCQSHPFTDA